MVSPQISRTLLADMNRMPTRLSCHAVRRGMRRLMPRARQKAARTAVEMQRAQGSDERRRDVQAGDMDGEVGRAPDEIHKGEGHGDAALLGQRGGHLF